MDTAQRTCGEEQKYMQSFGEEPRRKETTWETGRVCTYVAVTVKLVVKKYWAQNSGVPSGGRGFGCSNPPPHEIQKALQKIVPKFNPIVKTVKNC